MKPLWDAPSLGTLHARSARLAVVAMMFVSWFVLLPLFLISPYTVTIKAAWSKTPRRLWRGSVIVSVTLGCVLAMVTSPLVFPAGLPLPLPTDDPFFGPPMPGLITFVIVLNALLTAGLPLLPLAALSAISSVRSRRKEEAVRVDRRIE